MSAATALSLVPADEPIPSPVAPYVEANPASVLLQPKLRERFLAEIGAEIAAHVPDLTTKKGRRRADEAAAEAKRAADTEIAKLAAEKQALERAESARIAQEKRLAEEELARQRDRKHRADVMTAAKVAIMRAGRVEETAAKEIVKAMVAGQIPNVTVNF